jgi:uncharacterized protein (TIGR02271 family)
MQQPQSSTLVAVFDDYNTAERAARSLADGGIPRQDIKVESNFRTGAAGHSGYTKTEEEGGIKGFFHRLFGGGPDEEYAGHFAEAVRRGGAVVCATVPGTEAERAAGILDQAGAVDIDRRVSEYKQTGYQRYDPNARPYSAEEATRERERLRNTANATSIPVVEEELQVGKRAVRRGGVRVYSQVVEQPVEEQVTLREEHVRVERHATDRPLEPGEASRLRDQTIEVEEVSEEPVVQKRTRVREEVVIGKEVKERTENIRDSVRRTEVKVDRLGGEAEGDYRSEFRRDYERNYASSGVPYEEMEPAYDYGYTMARDPRYQGRSWSDVESDLQTDYARTHPGSTWDRMKNSIRYGWDRVTGRRP